MLHGDSQALYLRRTAAMSDRGTIMNVVSWILLAIVVCALVARFAMKFTTKRRRRIFGLDDLFIAFAALFSFGQTIAVSIESMQALGQHEHDLSVSQEVTYQKAEYAACILYIANLGCARISICLLIKKVLPGIIPRYTALVFAAFTGMWTVSGVLVTAFPCRLPKPWLFTNKSNCIDIVDFINYIGISNIIVEVLLIMIPLSIWNIRLSAPTRVSVSTVFLARLSIVAAVSAQLYFFNSEKPVDYTYTYWPTALCQQIAQNLSVITACLPCMHPFIMNRLADTAATTDQEVEQVQHDKPSYFRQYLDRKVLNFDPTSSQSSQTPFAEVTGEPYCRPLATHGLDCPSTHVHSQSVTRFPANVAKPVFNPNPPENVFNRLIEINVPGSRPGTSSSVTSPLDAPRTLNEVGVLPAIEWDSDCSVISNSRRSSPSRQPTAEYIFSRQKVISVSDERHLYDDGVKQFAPPLPSPRMPKRPPRAF